jgi:hypothetical protein
MKRMGFAALSAAVGYALVRLASTTAFQPWMQGLLGSMAGGLCAIAGWFIGGHFTGHPGGIGHAPVQPSTPKPTIIGWPAVEQKLQLWFNDLFIKNPASITEQCAALRTRLQLSSKPQQS